MAGEHRLARRGCAALLVLGVSVFAMSQQPPLGEARAIRVEPATVGQGPLEPRVRRWLALSLPRKLEVGTRATVQVEGAANAGDELTVFVDPNGRGVPFLGVSSASRRNFAGLRGHRRRGFRAHGGLYAPAPRRPQLLRVPRGSSDDQTDIQASANRRVIATAAARIASATHGRHRAQAPWLRASGRQRGGARLPPPQPHRVCVRVLGRLPRLPAQGARARPAGDRSFVPLPSQGAGRPFHPHGRKRGAALEANRAAAQQGCPAESKHGAEGAGAGAAGAGAAGAAVAGAGVAAGGGVGASTAALARRASRRAASACAASIASCSAIAACVRSTAAEPWLAPSRAPAPLSGLLARAMPRSPSEPLRICSRVRARLLERVLECLAL